MMPEGHKDRELMLRIAGALSMPGQRGSAQFR
jgi:hypothetical protein